MSKNSLIFFGATILIILLVGGLIFLVVPRIGEISLFSASPQGSSRLPADTVQAKVIQIIEEGEITLDETPNPTKYCWCNSWKDRFLGDRSSSITGNVSSGHRVCTSNLVRKSW